MNTTIRRWLIAGALGLLVVVAAYVLKHGALAAAMIWAGLVFLGGSAAILLGTLRWLGRVDQHALLRSEEKIQNKDALVIGAFFSLLLLLAYCVAAAAAAMQFPQRGVAAVLVALTWALASASVGGAFGFLLGHPRRLTDDKTDRAALSGLLRTGLDDMVDWLVKGLTTVLLVQAGPILLHLDLVGHHMAEGLIGTGATAANKDQIDAAAAFAEPLIVCFTLLGALATCLVTRTFLTGALSRADRTTTGAFGRVGLDLGEALILANAQRSLATRSVDPTAEVLRVAQKLSALSLADLHTVQEFATWAKAKSMLKQYAEALTGYEKAVAECDCDPDLQLDYAVALHQHNQRNEALARLEIAYDHLSRSTDPETRKNIFKSLTFELLYLPGGFERVIKLTGDYQHERETNGAPVSGGLLVNEACAWGQRFKWLAQTKGVLQDKGKTFAVNVEGAPTKLAEQHPDLDEAYKAARVAAERAVLVDPSWKRQLQLLLQRSVEKNRDLDDLEVFERFDDFRRIVDLPPFSETASTPAADTARATTGDPEQQVVTEQGKHGTGQSGPASS